MALMKAQELAILDRAIAELGRNSYLGPYLSDVRADVESDILSDFMPMAQMPSTMLVEAQRIREQAKAEAAEIREAADKAANKTRDEAHRTAEAVKLSAARELRDAIKRLGYSDMV